MTCSGVNLEIETHKAKAVSSSRELDLKPVTYDLAYPSLNLTHHIDGTASSKVGKAFQQSFPSSHTES